MLFTDLQMDGNNFPKNAIQGVSGKLFVSRAAAVTKLNAQETPEMER